jgi:hypothetical protein
MRKGLALYSRISCSAILLPILIALFSTTTFAAAPSITKLSPTSGAVGVSVTITGKNFGSTQGSSTVNFNGTVATPTSWSTTSIKAPVPTGATTGNAVVTVGGSASNGVLFTVAPIINSLSINSGAVGASVTISGNNFGSTQGTSTVKFNGVTASAPSWSTTSITAVVPSGATNGNVVVTVGTLASNGLAFTVVPAPSIGSLSLNSGAVGASVTVNGANFGSSQGTSTVKFNGTLATPTSWSSGAVTVAVPSGATSGNVVVHASGVDSNAVAFTVVPAPSITSLSSSSGTVGASVTISGSNFGATQGTGIVSFNGTQATPTSWTAGSIITTVPSGATAGNVVVFASGVNSNGAPFTVLPTRNITSLSVTSGPVGTSLTITGTNFGGTQGTSTLTLNGVSATVSSWSNTSLSTTVPTAATTGNVVVTVNNVASNGVSFTVTPYIQSLSPTSGPIGTSVTVSGSTFGASQGASTVKFNGTTAHPTNWSDTSITVPVPTGATTGNVIITINGTSSNGVNFTVTTTGATLQSIAITPGTAAVAAGGVQPFTATGTYSDNSTQDVTSSATWSSSDPSVVVIDATGFASALDNGQVTIQASVGSISGSASLTVTPGQLDAVITQAYANPNQWFEGPMDGKSIAVANDGFSRMITGDNSTSLNYRDEITYIRCLDQDCTTSHLKTFITVGSPTFNQAMVLGPDGFARIVYAVSTSTGPHSTWLHLIQCFDDDCGSATDTLVDGTSDSYSIAVAVGSDGTAYIAYDDGAADWNCGQNCYGHQGVGLASCSGGSCSTTKIADIYDFDAIGVAITMGADGNPVVLYEDSGCCQQYGPSDSVHYYTNGSDTVIASDGSGNDRYHEVMIGPDGLARLWYGNYTLPGIDFVQCGNVSCTASTITGLSWASSDALSFAIEPDGNPVFASASYYQNTVDYILCANADCSRSSDQLVAGTWSYPSVSLNIGSDGLPRIMAQTQSGPVEHIVPKVPTSLSVVPTVIVLPDGPAPPDGCPGSANYGIMVDIKYQVLDQDGNAFQSSGMVPHETGTFFTGQPVDGDIGPSPGYPTSTKTTAADGTFHDVPFGLCQNLPISNPGRTATQNITVLMNKKSYSVRSQTFTVTAPGTGSFGHGSITNNITSHGSGSDVSASR